jgi:hypothetical protein
MEEIQPQIHAWLQVAHRGCSVITSAISVAPSRTLCVTLFSINQ